MPWAGQQVRLRSSEADCRLVEAVARRWAGARIRLDLLAANAGNRSASLQARSQHSIREALAGTAEPAAVWTIRARGSAQRISRHSCVPETKLGRVDLRELS